MAHTISYTHEDETTYIEIKESYWELYTETNPYSGKSRKWTIIYDSRGAAKAALDNRKQTPSIPKHTIYMSPSMAALHAYEEARE